MELRGCRGFVFGLLGICWHVRTILSHTPRPPHPKKNRADGTPIPEPCMGPSTTSLNTKTLTPKPRIPNSSVLRGDGGGGVHRLARRWLLLRNTLNPQFVGCGVCSQHAFHEPHIALNPEPETLHPEPQTEPQTLSKIPWRSVALGLPTGVPNKSLKLGLRGYPNPKP